MTLSTVTLTWDFTDLVQAGQSAVLAITPTAQLTDTTDSLIVAETTRRVTFTGGTGQLAGIIANDNTDIAPSGTGYAITVTLPTGQVIYTATVIINFGAGATQDLSSLNPVSSVVTMQAYMPLDGGAFTGAVEPAISVLADGATIAVNAAAGNLFRVTLTGAHTLGSPTGGADGQMIRVEVTPSGHALSFGGAYNFGDAGAPSLNSAKRNTLGFAYNSGAASWDFLGAGTGF